MNTLAVMTAGMHSPLAATVGLEQPERRRRSRRRFHLPAARLMRRTPRSRLSPLYVASVGRA